MPDSWENLIVAINTSKLGGTLKFDDVSSNLKNEELWCKSMTQNQRGEALVDHNRKFDWNQQGLSKSRGRSKSRRGRITCYHCGKLGHMKREC